MRKSSLKTAEAIGLQTGMTALLALDPKYIAGKMMVVRALTLDMDLIAVNPSSNPLKSPEKDENIDFTALVPFQLAGIIDAGYMERLEAMKAILVGGGPLSNSLKNKIEKLKAPVYQTYGMTETLTHVALRRLNGSGKSQNYSLLPGVKIDLDDRGCLIVSADHILESVETNDMVEIINEREFRWLGRIDNVINSAGVKLHPELIEPKIEEILESTGMGDRRFFLGGLPDEKLGERLVLFLEGKLPEEHPELLPSLKKYLEKYHAPKQIVELERFEVTATGKLKRKLMIDSYRKGKQEI